MENNEYRYSCEKCAFYTNAKSTYEIHLSREKHKSGKNAVRCDKKYPEKCAQCNFKPKNNTTYLHHVLIYHSTKEERKTQFKYFCEKCDYGTFLKRSYNAHIETDRHKIICT